MFNSWSLFEPNFNAETLINEKKCLRSCKKLQKLERGSYAKMSYAGKIIRDVGK